MNISGSTEAIILIYLVKKIEIVVHSKEQKLIVVGSNNLKSIWECNRKFYKILQGAAEGALLIVEIKRIIKSF